MNLAISTHDKNLARNDCIKIVAQFSEYSYKIIANQFDQIHIPIYWIPGNHDNIPMMTSVFKNYHNFFCVNRLDLSDWSLIFLNTKLNGTDNGFLSKHELLKLENEIKSSPKKNQKCVIMHHPPCLVGTPLIDQYRLNNPDDFWSIAKNKIHLVICGHVHGDYSIKINNAYVETSPATCLQWVKGSEVINIENKIGYKVYKLSSTNYTTKTNIW